MTKKQMESAFNAIICDHNSFLASSKQNIMDQWFQATQLQINQSTGVQFSFTYGCSAMHLRCRDPLPVCLWARAGGAGSTKLQSYDLLNMLILNLRFSTLMMNIIWFHSPMEIYLNPLSSFCLGQPCIFSCSIKYLLRYINNYSLDYML
jgi:hypothetical protein